MIELKRDKELINIKRTIIYIGNYELPDKNAAAHRVIANGKAFRDLGYNVVFIGVDNSDTNEDFADKKETFFGFDCFKRKKAKTNIEWLYFLTNIDFYKQVMDKYENIYAIIGYNLPALILVRLKKEAGRKKIKIFSDSTEWYDIRKKGNSIPKFLIRYLDVYYRMKVINPRLDGIIAISSYLFDYYKSKGVHTVQVPPLVDTTDNKWANDFQVKPEKTQLLYAGSPFSLYNEPSYKDRIDLIIESVTQLKKDGIDFHMHIIGIEKEDVLKNFPDLISMVPYLSDSVTFYGRLPHLQVIKLLKNSDYSLFLRMNSRSVKAGFPTKFVESISCGIPVLTNKNSNVSDYLLEGVNGFYINLENKESIQASLKKALLIDRDRISLMKHYCYNSKTFDYRKFIEPFKSFFTE